MTLFPSKKKKIPFCKNADTLQLVVPSAEQTTDKRALPPRRNPLPVQTVGTFAGPRQELQRYQGREEEEEEEQDGKKEKNPAATASVRVIPVVPVLLWQQARALVKK